MGKPSTPEEAALEGEIVDLDHDNTFQKHKKEEEKRDKERAAERAATPRRLDLNDALGGSEQEDVIEMSKEEKSPEADDEEDDEEEGDVKVRDRDPSPYRTSLARHKEKMKRALDSITRLESEKKLKIPSLTISGDLIKDEVDDELPAVEEEEPQAPAESIEDVAVEQPNPDFFPRILYMQYDWVPAPFVLPSFENAIQYSIPYVIDRLTQVMSTLLNLDVEEKGDEHFYAEVERRIRAPRVNQISELLSPRSSPASPYDSLSLCSSSHAFQRGLSPPDVAPSHSARQRQEVHHGHRGRQGQARLLQLPQAAPQEYHCPRRHLQASREDLHGGFVSSPSSPHRFSPFQPLTATLSASSRRTGRTR